MNQKLNVALIFFLYNLEEILFKINNSFKMTRRPSI